MDKIIIEAPRLGKTVVGYGTLQPPETTIPWTRAIKAGNRVCVSGITAVNSEGRVIGKGDPDAQAKKVFENIKIILEDAGASLDDIVVMRSYLLKREYILSLFKERAKIFKRPPAATAVVVAGLLREGALFEVEVEAVI